MPLQVKNLVSDCHVGYENHANETNNETAETPAQAVLLRT
jgi:hypothetical protein